MLFAKLCDLSLKSTISFFVSLVKEIVILWIKYDFQLVLSLFFTLTLDFEERYLSVAQDLTAKANMFIFVTKVQHYLDTRLVSVTQDLTAKANMFIFVTKGQNHLEENGTGKGEIRP